MSYLLADLRPKLVETNNSTGQGDTNQLVFTCPYCLADVAVHCRLGGPYSHPVWSLLVSLERNGWESMTVYPSITGHPVAQGQDACPIPVVIVDGTLYP